MTHDDTRNGTTDLFAALDIASGSVITDFRDTPTAADLLRFFTQIDRSVPHDLAIQVVLDNLSTHPAPVLVDWLARPRQRRWHLHHIPTSSTWLNLVERWFKGLTDRRLRRGSVSSAPHLIDAITLWAEHGNANPKPFIWRAQADAILAKVRRGREALTNNVNSVSHH